MTSRDVWILAAACVVSGGCALSPPGESTRVTPRQDGETGAKGMSLGNFSVSLAVKDLKASRAFYEKLGFRSVGGDSKSYSIMQNDTSTIGLFQGMFDKNILTYNPGWDRTCATLPEFKDVRDLQKDFMAKGLTPVAKADESTTGPASFVLVDPDGNQILFDQHVAKPSK